MCSPRGLAVGLEFVRQALDVIKKLKEVMPIDRAKMKLRVTTDEGVVEVSTLVAMTLLSGIALRADLRMVCLRPSAAAFVRSRLPSVHLRQRPGTAKMR